MSTPTLEPAEERAAADAEASGATRRRGLGSVLPWIVAIIAVAVAVFVLVTDSGGADDQQIEEVSGRAVSTLTTWSAGELEDVEASVAEFGTPRFQEEARGIFAEFGSGLEEAEVTSKGEVLEIAVADVAGERAIALASVRQRVTNANAPEQPIESCWGARVTLVQQDGDWRVDRLSLFGPNACDDQTSTDG